MWVPAFAEHGFLMRHVDHCVDGVERQLAARQRGHDRVEGGEHEGNGV
jgi:hypothetical protein